MPERPRVSTIAPGASFADALARLLIDGSFAGLDPLDPLALARSLILLPNRRSARTLQAALIRQTPGKALLLPRLMPLGDVDEDELVLDIADDPDPTLPSAISPVGRRLALVGPVRGWLASQGRADAPLAEALRLADALGRTLDQLTTEGLKAGRLREALAARLPELAGHWQESLDFLDLVLVDWPHQLALRGELDAADRRNRQLLSLAERWRDRSPTYTVIAAGSTGSVPATAALLKTVCRLPLGAVILPGLDLAMDEDAWDLLGDQHPQFGMKQLLASMEVARGEVSTLGADTSDARASLLRSAMLPPTLTERWRTETGSACAIAGLATVEADTPEEEALVAALAMRAALDTAGKTATLVTPDTSLARRVVAQMARFGVAVDSSAGRPLALTPPALFLRLLAEAVQTAFAPPALLALLQHPLCALDGDRAATRAAARALDRHLFRGARPAGGLQPLMSMIEARVDRREAPAALRAVSGWFAAARDAFAAFDSIMARARVSFPDALDAHLAAAARLSDAEALWSGDAGRSLADLLTQARDHAGAIDAMPPEDYPSAFLALLDGAVVRPAFGAHPRLSIVGPIEARLAHADLMILGGLNEGVWPATSTPDPWLSPGVRRALGLPTIERRIGQSAHDFVQAAAAPEVLLTRARRAADGPTVASRFWLRLAACAGGTLPTADDLLALARTLDHAEAPTPATEPRPRPPARWRPRAISVTDVEKLMTDPYAVYVRRVLKIRKLEPLDAGPDAAERGRLVHRALELWLKQPPALWTESALYDLLTGQLRASGAEPLYRALLDPRLKRIADCAARQLAGDLAEWRPLACEVKAQAQVRGIMLTGVADRIDVAADGSLRILDYKTGAPPSAKQQKYGYAPQLPLLGHLARQGLFTGVAAAPVAALGYWRVNGGRDERGFATDAPKYDTAPSVAAWIDESAALLDRLIASFLLGDEPFRCALKPDYAKGDDFHHLARMKEWRGTSAGE